MRKDGKKDEKKPKGKLSKIFRKFLMAPLATSAVVAALTYGLAVLPVAVAVISYNAISDDEKKKDVDDKACAALSRGTRCWRRRWCKGRGKLNRE